MNETRLWLERPPRQRVVVALIALFFAITNLPWTLDDYDQAKQAYVSFEMVEQGHWLYQHTPNQSVATKPPLIGWVSAAAYEVTRWWEGAWRLPSFVAAIALVYWMAKYARSAYGSAGAFFATSALGLNLLSPRLATLVRTDMPLALVIFLLGAQIYWKIRRAEEWTTSDRAIAFALLTAALLIKGPIVYAFLLPGLITYQVLRRKGYAPSGWSGWWPWLFSLAVFLAWVIGGILTQEGFYESVVVREFAGRFTETFHRPQPIYFYLPHLLHKFAPWSLLIVGLAVFYWRRREQLSLHMQPDTVWLVCWSIGGLVLMSLIPSKRVDRIFPVVPPLCLLLGAQVVRALEHVHWRVKIQPWLNASVVFAFFFTAGYATFKIGSAYWAHDDALVKFSGEVRRIAAANHWQYAVVGGHEEGMLLYLRRDYFLSRDDAVKQWNLGRLGGLVVRNEPGQTWLDTLHGARVEAVSDKAPGKPQYSFLTRSDVARH